MGCDLHFSILPYSLKQVSIHAPTWGATDVEDVYDVTEDVSIHAPTWGAT